MVCSFIPLVLSGYAEDEPVYVEDLGSVWHFHNYFDDFYINKSGFQISNNLTEQWAYIVVGVSFTFRNRNYEFWSDSLPFSWVGFNGSSYVELNGTISLINGAFGSLNFVLHYKLEWNSSYILIEPIFIANLKYSVSNVKAFLRIENISVSGNIENDLCAFLFNNQTYEYFLPAYFEHSVVNIFESLNHLFIYDNVTWKFVDFVWNWNYTLNNIETPINISVNGYGTVLQLNFSFGNFQEIFIFQYSLWWHDPTETRYMRSDQHTVNGLTAYKLGTSQTTTSKYVQWTTSLTVYAGIRVCKRDVNGVETEITAGTPVAVVSRDPGTGGALLSATWNCPETSLNPTDCIRVYVYRRLGTGSWTAVTSFATEQLGASKLDASTWTVYYYLYHSGTYARFYWGTTNYNSRIENFTWTVAPSKSWHDISNWNFNLLTKKWFPISIWNFNILPKSWVQIALWIVNVTTKTWHDITLWIMNAAAKMWHNITSWIVSVGTKVWHSITTWTTWIFTEIGKAWHQITIWVLTIQTEGKFPFIILIGGIFILAISIIYIFKWR